MTLPAAQPTHQLPAESLGASAVAEHIPLKLPVQLRMALLLGVVAGTVAGCGFQLQGAGVMPDVVATTYVEAPQRFTEFHARLTDALTARGVDLTESRDEAGAVLRILEDETGQRVLSVSAATRRRSTRSSTRSDFRWRPKAPP